MFFKFSFAIGLTAIFSSMEEINMRIFKRQINLELLTIFTYYLLKILNLQI